MADPKIVLSFPAEKLNAVLADVVAREVGEEERQKLFEDAARAVLRNPIDMKQPGGKMPLQIIFEKAIQQEARNLAKLVFAKRLEQQDPNILEMVKKTLLDRIIADLALKFFEERRNHPDGILNQVED